MSTVKENSTIILHFTGRLKNDKVIDTTIGKGEVQITLGKNQVIKGIEKAVLGLDEGSSISVVLPCEDAYGVVNPDLQQEVAKSDLPVGMEFKKGMTLMSENEDGSELPLTIKKVNPTSIVLDANHKLAGKELFYDIQVTKIID